PGGQVYEADAVLFRALAQVFTLHQLQKPEAQEQEGKEGKDDEGHRRKMAPHPLLFIQGHGAAGGNSQELKVPKMVFFQIRLGVGHGALSQWSRLGKVLSWYLVGQAAVIRPP